MLIKKEEIKSTIKKMVDGHGQIHKLYNSNSNVIGYLVRYEKSNTNDHASVVFNVSINEHYYDTKPKTFFQKSIYKYFAIKHAENFDVLKNKKRMFILNSADSEINEIMIRQIDETLRNFFFNTCTEKYTDEFDTNENDISLIYNRVFTHILNVMNYYKNKKIKVYLDLN